MIGWIFVIVNSFLVVWNVVDWVYLGLWGGGRRRCVFEELSDEGGGNVRWMILKEFGGKWYLVVLGGVVCYFV